MLLKVGSQEEHLKEKILPRTRNHDLHPSSHTTDTSCAQMVSTQLHWSRTPRNRSGGSTTPLLLFFLSGKEKTKAVWAVEIEATGYLSVCRCRVTSSCRHFLCSGPLKNLTTQITLLIRLIHPLTLRNKVSIERDRHSHLVGHLTDNIDSGYSEPLAFYLNFSRKIKNRSKIKLGEAGR